MAGAPVTPVVATRCAARLMNATRQTGRSKCPPWWGWGQSPVRRTQYYSAACAIESYLNWWRTREAEWHRQHFISLGCCEPIRKLGQMPILLRLSFRASRRCAARWPSHIEAVVVFSLVRPQPPVLWRGVWARRFWGEDLRGADP